MSEELTPAQKRTHSKNEFNRKYGQHYIVYLALAFTAILSFVSGLVLPFTPDANGYISITFGGIVAALYYSIGFLTNGEASANYWFGKLTDHDKDNTLQQWIAGVMLAISIIVSLVTALAAAAQIAYLLGVLAEFQSMPAWAQEWVVWSIPSMWTMNAVSGMAFKAFGDEAAAERDANSTIRVARQRITTKKVEAKAKYWADHADTIAEELGRMEAEKELNDYAVKLQVKRQEPIQTRAFATDTVVPTLAPKQSADK